MCCSKSKKLKLLLGQCCSLVVLSVEIIVVLFLSLLFSMYGSMNKSSRLVSFVGVSGSLKFYDHDFDLKISARDDFWIKW